MISGFIFLYCQDKKKKGFERLKTDTAATLDREVEVEGRSRGGGEVEHDAVCVC